MTIEMRGSTRRQPKRVISRAPTMTPRENRASWSEWSQTLFMLKFRADIFCKSSVAAPFPTKATTATRSISLPGISVGAVSLLIVLPEDEGDDDGKGDAVDERGDKFDFAVAVRFCRGCGTAGNLFRPVAEEHGRDVAQIVDGVRDQRHALNHQAENHLEDDDPAIDHDGEKQVFQRRRLFMLVVGMVVFHVCDSAKTPS